MTMSRPKAVVQRAQGWAILWRSRTRQGGEQSHLVGDGRRRPLWFDTRAAAVEHIKQHYGYIATRRDLRAEPHGWLMPIAVKVESVTRLRVAA